MRLGSSGRRVDDHVPHDGEAGGAVGGLGTRSQRPLGEPFAGRAASSTFIVTFGFWATVPPERPAPTAIEVIDSDAVPERFSLDQNFPNPFNPATRIRYALAEPASARLTIYDVLGREVSVLVDRPQAAGTYEVAFEAGSLPSGLYFYQLRAGRFSSIRQMSLIK